MNLLSRSRPARRSAAVTPSVVVVDPQFDAYRPLAANARLGRLQLHFRSSGADAIKLARRMTVDAWLVAAELDDMAGHDFVELLRRTVADAATGRVALVDDSRAGSRRHRLAADEAVGTGADALLSHPISIEDLTRLLERPVAERSQVLAAGDRSMVTLQVGAGAALVAIAVLVLG